LFTAAVLKKGTCRVWLLPSSSGGGVAPEGVEHEGGGPDVALAHEGADGGGRGVKLGHLAKKKRNPHKLSRLTMTLENKISIISHVRVE
jgi:hypothetical protein